MSDKKKKKRRIIPGFISHDFLRKLIALFFAILVWFRVAARLDDNQNIRGIPVDISMPGYVLLDDSPPEVSVLLKGSKQRLNKITPNDIKIRVKLDNPQVGENKISIRKRDITIPKGVAIESIEPDPVIMHIDEKETKTVKVKLKNTGSLLEGYALNAYHLIPETVTISGPVSIVGKMKFIFTKPIVLGKHMVNNFDKNNLEIDTEGKKNITVTPNTVYATIEISKKYDESIFKDVKVEPFGYLPGKTIEIIPPNVSIKVIGVKNEIEMLTRQELIPLIDLTEIDPEEPEHNIKVQCWSKKDLSDISINPQTVKVKITENK